jgi:hypothetical protein
MGYLAEEDIIFTEDACPLINNCLYLKSLSGERASEYRENVCQLPEHNLNCVHAGQLRTASPRKLEGVVA